MWVFVRLSLVLAIAATMLRPALAAPPAIAEYFTGTWACDSALGSKGVKVYGFVNAGQTLVLANPYVTATSQFGEFIENYVQDAHGITVTSHTGTSAYIGSSAGWDGDLLSFVGPVSIGARTLQERETYRRIDNDHFNRMFEQAPSAKGPWTRFSHESCRRITAATTVAVNGGSTPTGLQTLAMRVAGPGATAINVGTLPADWAGAVPLPEGVTLVGSVQRAATTQFYYDLGSATDAVAAYGRRLQAAGWTTSPSLAPFLGGFVTQMTVPNVLCGADGKPSIAITTPAGPERSFSVTIGPAVAFCGSGEPLALLQRLRGPLPTLAAPAGTSMTASGLPFRIGSTGAKLVSTASAATLLDAFAAQMVDAKWTRLDSAVGPRSATASFTFTDDHKTPWEAVITIYAAPGSANTYYSLIDTTNLNGESLGNLTPQ